MSQTSHEHLHRFIRLLTTASANAALYHLEHLQVARLCRQALDELNSLFLNHSNITLKIIENQLIFDNRQVEPNLAIQRLMSSLQVHDISHLQIEPGIYSEELLGLINTLSKRPEKQVDLTESEHIHFGQIEVRYRKGGSSVLTTEQALADIENKEADRFMDVYQAVQTKKKINLAGITEIVNNFVNTFSEHSDSFLAIAPLRSMDEYTYTHSTNICLLNLAQARQLGIEGQLLSDIGIAAMLHDVGKMFISPDILGKTEALDEEEWRIMQQHPRLGAEYLLNTPGVPRLAVVNAFEHHMRYDGQGYPKTKRPWQMNLCSHMTAISDTYDAMRTNRSYEESLELDKIINTMFELAGTKLHPQLTYSFLQVLYKREKESQTHR